MHTEPEDLLATLPTEVIQLIVAIVVRGGGRRDCVHSDPLSHCTSALTIQRLMNASLRTTGALSLRSTCKAHRRGVALGTIRMFCVESFLWPSLSRSILTPVRMARDMRSAMQKHHESAWEASELPEAERVLENVARVDWRNMRSAVDVLLGSISSSFHEPNVSLDGSRPSLWENICDFRAGIRRAGRLNCIVLVTKTMSYLQRPAYLDMCCVVKLHCPCVLRFVPARSEENKTALEGRLIYELGAVYAPEERSVVGLSQGAEVLERQKWAQVIDGIADHQDSDSSHNARWESDASLGVQGRWIKSQGERIVEWSMKTGAVSASACLCGECAKLRASRWSRVSTQAPRT